MLKLLVFTWLLLGLLVYPAKISSTSTAEPEIFLQHQPPHQHQHQQQQKQQHKRPDRLARREGDSQDELHLSQVSESSDRRLFAGELLRLLHEQYGTDGINKKRDMMTERQSSMTGLLEALGADGDLRRLIDWVQNSFNLASIGELTTQFVVSKLGSVNCAAILRPDDEETLVPRFLLFNEHFVDVPFELPIQPTAQDCLANGKFDPKRKTIILIHGYLAGYALVDGLTNIKNRLLDLNKRVQEAALAAMAKGNGSHQVLLEDLEEKVRLQQQNVIVIDWFNGANPVPRANYIRSAVNSQVVGQLIARFLRVMAEQCGTPALNFHIIAHSLGCHVAGFVGKAMASSGHVLGKITHLDPVGLCFGRLFSEPRFRLHPNDALDTQAVHVSLNLFDNPLDGTKSNFLVNGGRDQVGCGGQSELKNSTSSSVSLLFDSEARFAPCSHLRALALFEDDLSSEPQQCQIVGYKCANYNRFLAGKCGRCDLANNQCRLMSLPPISAAFQRLSLSERHSLADNLQQEASNRTQQVLAAEKAMAQIAAIRARLDEEETLEDYDEQPELELHSRRRRSVADAMIAHTIGKIRANTMNTLLDGWTQLKGPTEGKLHGNKYPLTLAEHKQHQLVKPKEHLREKQLVSHQIEKLPVGSQSMPEGAISGPLYYVGTGPITPYCVNYYQFRLLVAEARLQRMMLDNKLAPSVLSQRGHLPSSTQRSMLHLTVKLTDTQGHFFKGFTLFEDARALQKFPIESRTHRQVSGSDNMYELTMLLNSTRQAPSRIGEAVISYYFHRIVLADMIEINYMSNISPDVRASYSSVLCPIAVNDGSQLVRYVECDKVASS